MRPYTVGFSEVHSFSKFRTYMLEVVLELLMGMSALSAFLTLLLPSCFEYTCKPIKIIAVTIDPMTRATKNTQIKRPDPYLS